MAESDPLREQVARLLSETNDEDWCFRRVDDWKALEECERLAQPQEEPFSDYEDCNYWLAKADTLLPLFAARERAAAEKAAHVAEMYGGYTDWKNEYHPGVYGPKIAAAIRAQLEGDGA